MAYPLINVDTIHSLTEMGAVIGNHSYFKNIFETFRESFQSDLKLIKQKATDGSMEQVRILAHRMKSSARTIGASALGERFCAIESSIVHGTQKMEDLLEELKELDLLYQETLKGFDRYLH